MGFLHHLREEHDAIKSRLDTLERGLEAFGQGKDADLEGLHELAEQLMQRTLPGHLHEMHVLGRRLADHGEQPRATAEALHGAGETVLDIGQRLLEHLDDASEDVVVPRDRLPEIGREFANVTRKQLQREERELFACAEHVLTAAEWRQLAAHAITDGQDGAHAR